MPSDAKAPIPEGNKILSVAIPTACYIEARKRLIQHNNTSFQKAIFQFLYELSIGSASAVDIIERAYETTVAQKISESQFKIEDMSESDMNSLYSLLEKEQNKSLRY